MELYEKIDAMCRQHDVTITQMCRDAGISRAAISDLKHGRSQFLSSATIHKLSYYFRVPMDFWYVRVPMDFWYDGLKDDAEQDFDKEQDKSNHQFYTDALEEIKKLVRLCKFGTYVLLGFSIACWFALFQILL